jgi:hypothetical protein
VRAYSDSIPNGSITFGPPPPAPVQFVIVTSIDNNGVSIDQPPLGNIYLYTTTGTLLKVISTVARQLFGQVGSSIDLWSIISDDETEPPWTIGDTVVLRYSPAIRLTRGFSVAYANNVWIAAGQGIDSIIRSENGLTWSPVTGTVFTNAGLGALTYGGYSVAYGDGVWIAVGEGTNTILRSIDDGRSWNPVVSDGAQLFRSSGYGGFSVKYANGVWIAAGERDFALRGILRSITSDGSIWSSTIGGDRMSIGYSVAFGNGVWVAAGIVGNTIVRSTNNGRDWYLTSGADTMIAGYSVAYQPPTAGLPNGVWILVGEQVPGGGSSILRSTDNGENWSSVSGDNFQAIWSVAYANNVWIAVGFLGIYRSTDNGLSWTRVATITFGGGESGRSLAQSDILVAYGGGVWVAVKNGPNPILRSTDNGASWNVVVQSGITNGNSVAYHDGIFVVVGQGTTPVLSLPALSLI